MCLGYPNLQKNLFFCHCFNSRNESKGEGSKAVVPYTPNLLPKPSAKTPTPMTTTIVPSINREASNDTPVTLSPQTSVKMSAEPSQAASAAEPEENKPPVDLYESLFTEKMAGLMTPTRLFDVVSLHKASGITSQYFFLTNEKFADKFTVARLV